MLLGTNLGNKEENLRVAIQMLENLCVSIVSKSSIYQTQAWGMEGGDFYNQALVVTTELKPLDVLLECLIIEKKLGRERKALGSPYESRTMDIDILHASDYLIDMEVLTLPHPRLHLRKFALAPLAEIDPNWQHPFLLKTSQELLDICSDSSALEKLSI